ncbi:MAG: hypothetical protein C0603_00500 [Denitrovibrio sp.]|nr:MAG: hypothetical protein C0603_00500 [Denitrovibrio sp.]
MKKMTVLVSVENGCAADKVMKLAKEKLGLKKGARVLSNEGFKVLFVSGIIQKTVENVEELKKHEDYDMVIIPSFWEGVQASPRIYDVKVYMNNTLGFSVFVCAVPNKPTESQVEDAAENLCDIISANIGL